MKIVSTLQWSLLAAATIFNGILAGGSLIKSVVELPARRTIGLPAMAAYHRGRGPSHRLLDLPCAGSRYTGPHNRTRDRLRGRPGCTCRRRFVWVLRRSALGGPRFRDDPRGPELAQAPLRDTRGGDPRRHLPCVYEMADGPGNPSARGVRNRRAGVGLPRSSRPMNE